MHIKNVNKIWDVIFEWPLLFNRPLSNVVQLINLVGGIFGMGVERDDGKVGFALGVAAVGL